MKRHGNLFCKITDPKNIALAHNLAKRGKSRYAEVQMVNKDPEKYFQEIQESLVNHSFSTSPYATKRIYEPKERLIYKLPYYPDRIVHHAVMNVIQPIWDKIFIYDLYSAVPGKGLHRGSYRLRQFLKDTNNTQYCLKFDIQKYYPSVVHEILFDLIKRKIKCSDTLWLLQEIITSVEGTKNIPIGNYLSQYFGNIYLNWFDHWIKENLGMQYYIRYCDDGVILSQDKTSLNELKDIMTDYLENHLELTLNKKTRIFPVDSTGIDFLGYRHFRNYTLLRKSSAARFKKKIYHIEMHHESMNPQSIISSIMSYVGWLKHCDSYHLANKYIYQNLPILEIVDDAAKKIDIKNPLLNTRPQVNV